MWPKAVRPLVLMAPMSGLTDSPFRRFVKRVEPRCLVFTEFLSARHLSKSKSAPSALRFHGDEQPVIVQLYGKSPEEFRQAAIQAESQGAAGIDINMGCPAKKVVAHQHGSMLMKDRHLAANIVRAVKEAVSIPVSAKTRLGWEDDSDLVPFCCFLEEQGLDAITIHGRTYAQKFSGAANWSPIYSLKKRLAIPVFGNGDITSADMANERLKNLDGVMVGRAAISHPYLIKEICSIWYDSKPWNIDRYDLNDQISDWLFFAKLTAAEMPEWVAARRFRKFLIGLVEKWELPPKYRLQATKVSTLQDIAEALNIFAEAAKNRLD